MTKRVVNSVHVPTGLPVVEATDEFLVTVTLKDGINGNPKDPLNCALAISCKRQPGITWAEINRTRALVGWGDVIYRYDIPKSTQVLLAAYDITGEFPPGEYWFVPPAPSSQLAARRERDAQKKAKKAEPEKRSTGPISEAKGAVRDPRRGHRLIGVRVASASVRPG